MAWLSTNSAATGASSITNGTGGVLVGVAPFGYKYNNFRCCCSTGSSNKPHPVLLLLQSLASNRRRTTRSSSNRRRAAVIRAEAETPIPKATTIGKSGIKIINNPPESSLSDLGVGTWPKWGCPPSKFPWTYSSKETCYLLKGKVTVYPDGSDEIVEIGAGDLVEFPKGMSCTWDVSEAVDKHYKFD